MADEDLDVNTKMSIRFAELSAAAAQGKITGLSLIVSTSDGLENSYYWGTAGDALSLLGCLSLSQLQITTKLDADIERGKLGNSDG